jgi:putative Ca2+/H+ antiporter (TMEM165/GDT1 family)
MVEQFCDRLLAVDLPELPVDRRTEVAAFVARRSRQVGGPIGLGVTIAAAAVHAFSALVPDATVRVLARRPLPIVGEYVRFVRSLAYAYVWETWPDTSTAGRPR